MHDTTLLRITEIFFSLQGETSRSGLPTSFIRLTGCPLRCQYCDTSYAFHGGQSLTLGTIIETVQNHPTPYVTVTGGEPLAQKNCFVLLKVLCDYDYQVSLETSGAMDIQNVDSRVSIILDIKTPASGEAHRNYLNNLKQLSKKDEIKFVICNQEDYEWSKDLIDQHQLHKRSPILFSPCAGTQDPKELANWILQDHLPVRLQIQLHKLLWGDEPGK